MCLYDFVLAHSFKMGFSLAFLMIFLCSFELFIVDSCIDNDSKSYDASMCFTLTEYSFTLLFAVAYLFSTCTYLSYTTACIFLT